MTTDWLLHDLSAFHRAAVRQNQPVIKQWCEEAIARREKDMSYPLDVLKAVETKVEQAVAAGEAKLAQFKAEAEATLETVRTEFQTKLAETEDKLKVVLGQLEVSKPLSILPEELPEFEKHLPAPATLTSVGPAKAV